ncbi:MAG: hypothetical protein Q4P34_06065 [Tissierellia bacterium]|nr:hypothetical protein [Tissierellia bacterium]
MLKSICIDYNIIEMMQFYWESIASRDKVVDSYFIEIAQKPEMKVLYSDDFNEDSVRKVLSAIMNRERLNNPTKKESRFWNLNLWMLEDLDNMRAMLKPIKLLNLDQLYDEFSDKGNVENLEVHFIPGHEDTYYKEDSKLIINFFKIMVDYMDPEVVKIEGEDFKEFVISKAREILS